jgi:hypothetical protein
MALVGTSVLALSLLTPVAQAQAYPVIPLVGWISPHYGPTAGGTRVTVFGGGLQHVIRVTFGGVPGTQLHVISGVKVTVASPPHAAGRTYVRLVYRDSFGTRSTLASPSTRFGYRG